MTIWQRTLAGNLVVVGIEGRLDQSLTPELEVELDQVLVAGRREIIIDMSAVSYINSGGLRCLVTAWRRATQQGGRLALAAMTPRVDQIVSMVGFDKVFEIYPSPGEARRAWEEEE
ncbi:MAG: STAS domain-containing protein [Candidatus Promineifilaceae bacterium]|nr:STAS domain-containing protein [Candidatus Promineifilaceae bacterium]